MCNCVLEKTMKLKRFLVESVRRVRDLLNYIWLDTFRSSFDQDDGFGVVLKENSSSFDSRSPLVPNHAAQALVTVTLNMAAFTGPERASCVMFVPTLRNRPGVHLVSYKYHIRRFGVRIRLHLKPYRYSLLQAIKDTDKIARRNFCVDMSPRSPDLTLLDLFFWGFIKDMVYVPPFPATLPEIRARIYAAAEHLKC
ncbi:hypothetical protein J6590_056546 [Homalodisca vitripennis]|nr:hypothetical protein J6590_056546 [Homalodisca vitripennis]